jgi:hypothetical protein
VLGWQWLFLVHVGRADVDLSSIWQLLVISRVVSAKRLTATAAIINLAMLMFVPFSSSGHEEWLYGVLNGFISAPGRLPFSTTAAVSSPFLYGELEQMLMLLSCDLVLSNYGTLLCFFGESHYRIVINS